jgi:uncharacterized YigZ family protein
MIDPFFNTVTKHSEILFKERNSKFYGITFPIQSEEDFKIKQAEIKEQFPDAGHHCYAFRIGIQGEKYRYSDDGEPNNSAGKPIYGQLLSSEVTNVGAIVVRYFGGTKLGVGGLISAYKEGCKLSLEANTIIKTELKHTFTLSFDYNQTSIVDQLASQFELEELSAKFDSNCEKVFLCSKSQSEEFESICIEKQLGIKKAID